MGGEHLLDEFFACRAGPLCFVEVRDVPPGAAYELGEVVVASTWRLMARDDDPRGQGLDRADGVYPGELPAQPEAGGRPATAAGTPPV